MVRFFFPQRDTNDDDWQRAIRCLCDLPGVKSKVGRTGAFLIVPWNALNLARVNCDRIVGSRGYRIWAPLDRGTKVLVKLRQSLVEIPEVRWAEPGVSINAKFGLLFDRIKPIVLTPYQIEEPVKFAKVNTLFHWSPGSGKSSGSLLWALLEPTRSILVVTTAKARLNWRREIKRYTKLEPELMMGESDSGWKSLPRIAITAWETLSCHIDELEDLAPCTIILDESHRAANRQRFRQLPAEVEQVGEKLPVDPIPGIVFDQHTGLWVIPPEGAKQLEDGRWVTFEDRKNIASSTSKLARIAKRRALTTATPIKNRRVDLWAQLDYLDPWEWGNQKDWRVRYTGAAEIGYNGSLIDTGRTNTKELVARLNRVRSWVPVSVTHKHLPKMRRDTLYIDVESQNKSDFKKDELKAAHGKGHASGLEADLLDACSRKRRPVATHIAEAIGGVPPPDFKIVVFTGRRADVVKLKEEVVKALKKFRLELNCFGAEEIVEHEAKEGQEQGAAQHTIKIWASHGDDSAQVRHTYVESYMECEGPAVFIGTRDAFGESIDLHDTDLVYMTMLPWTNGDILQNEYRFSRLGGTRTCLILYVIAEGTADEHVASYVIDKLPDMIEVGGHEELKTLRETLRGGRSEAQLRDDLARSILAGMVAEAVETMTVTQDQIQDRGEPLDKALQGIVETVQQEEYPEL